jgi:alpha-glucosidase
MSKGLIFTAMFLLTISLGLGQVLVEKDFSSSLADSPLTAKVLPQSLDYQFHKETGGRLWIKDCSDGVTLRLAPGTVDPAVHPTLYMSFLLRSLSTATKEKFAGVVLYRDGQEVFGLGNDYVSDQFSFWTSDGKGIAIGEIPVAVDSEVHKIVMRVDFRADGPERIRVALDPFCRRSEDRQPDHIWTEIQHELSFDEIRFRCGNTDCQWEFDEFRVGTTWDCVTPSDDKPGTHIENLTAGTLPSGPAEMIAEGIARFWPSGIQMSDVLPSFALEKPRSAISSLPDSWAIQPRFIKAGQNQYVHISIPAEFDLYGTGEVTGSLLRNGHKIVLFNKDNYGYGKPDQLYQSHPWVLGLRPDGSAFGIIFDTPCKAQLDLRTDILFSVPADAPSFPVIIIEGQTPQEVMTKLADLTGRMPLPPRWAIGYHQCRYSYNPDARVRRLVDTFRAKQIPCDVIWFDIDYMDGFRVFTFDPNQFPDPRSTNEYLHAMGFKSVWMIDPGVKYDPGYFVYDSGTKADVWVRNASGNPFIGPVWPGDCVFPDFTVPAVCRWWAGLYTDFMAMGIDGVWNDMNEPAVFKEEYDWTMPLDNLHRGGDGLPAGPHIQYHNVYGMLMVKASREGIQKANPEKRPFVLSRANFLGGHRYAATWTGDNKATWEHLKWSIPMSLNLSLSGQPFNGPDIGGFAENATPQLWAHWISVGAFYPFSRAHTSKDTLDQEPWSFGEKTENAARLALQRRYRLMPYLYTAFHESHSTGLPIMRPVFFADPTDLSLRMEDQSFLLGRDLMVVPKWAQDARMPKTIWRSISIVPGDGGDEYQCDLKVRAGAIVPLGPVVQTTEQIPETQSLTLVVVLDERQEAYGTLYEDAGDGYGHLRDEYCLSTFKAGRQDNAVIVKCQRQDGRWKSQKRLVSVTVIGPEKIFHGFGDIVTGVKVIMEDNL